MANCALWWVQQVLLGSSRGSWINMAGFPVPHQAKTSAPINHSPESLPSRGPRGRWREQADLLSCLEQSGIGAVILHCGIPGPCLQPPRSLRPQEKNFTHSANFSTRWTSWESLLARASSTNSTCEKECGPNKKKNGETS